MIVGDASIYCDANAIVIREKTVSVSQVTYTELRSGNVTEMPNI